MAERAHVTSVEAIKAFRSNLLVYLSKARPALEEVSSDVMRTRLWVQTDQRSHWEGQVKRRKRVLEEAQAALFSASMSVLQDVTAAEQVAVHRAKRDLAEAEEKLRLVKKWDRDFENQTQPLLKQMEKLNTLLAHDIPNAAAHLSEVITTLEGYANILSPAGSLEPALPEGGAAVATEPASPSGGKEKA